ncbi:hypothetical protein HDU83_004000 [Entophlyctis luteolus]|nr:hypothetical protein HDU83_004000 [Entophlyctis luteolus]
MPNRQRLLLVFVPGFYGTEASFASFPSDVVHSINAIAGESRVADIIFKILPPFDCKGSNSTAVAHLVLWLSNNAPAVEYPAVVLLGHSMGGLISADALRSISETTPRRVNICALLAYDAPFYGLHSAAISDVPASLTALASDLLPDQQTRTAAYNSLSAATSSAYESAMAVSKSTYTSTAALAAQIARSDASAAAMEAARVGVHALGIPDTATVLGKATSIAAATSAQISQSATRAYESAAAVVPLNEAGKLAAVASQTIYNSIPSSQQVQVASHTAYSVAAKAVKAGSKVAEVGGTAAIIGGTAVVGGSAVVGGAVVAASVGAVGLATALGVATVAATGATVAGVGSAIVVAGKFLAPRKTLTVTSRDDDPATEDESGAAGKISAPEKNAVETPLESKDKKEELTSFEAKLADIEARKIAYAAEIEQRRLAIETRLLDLETAAAEEKTSIFEPVRADLPENHSEFAAASAHFEQLMEKYAYVKTSESSQAPDSSSDSQPPEPSQYAEDLLNSSIKEPEVAVESVSRTTTVSYVKSYLPSKTTLVTTTLALGAYYYTGGWVGMAMPTLQSVAVGWVSSQAAEASKHLKFLYPLWGETRSSCEARVKFLKEEVDADRLMFHGFYIEVPASNKSASNLPETSKTFIRPPPDCEGNLFTKVPFDDFHATVVSAHMAMLIRQKNIGTYWHLVDETALKLTTKLLQLERIGIFG